MRVRPLRTTPAIFDRWLKFALGYGWDCSGGSDDDDGCWVLAMPPMALITGFCGDQAVSDGVRNGVCGDQTVGEVAAGDRIEGDEGGDAGADANSDSEGSGGRGNSD